MRELVRPLLASLVVSVGLNLATVRAQDCGPGGLAGSDPAYGPSGTFAYVDVYAGGPPYYEPIWFIAAGPEGGPYTQEISGGGLRVMTPAWSPDGTRIAYSDYFRILVAELPAGGGYGVELTGGFDSNPTWSPDGSTIAFGRLTNGAVCSVPASGGTVTTLWPGSNPAWSPTQNLIAYQLGGDIWLGQPGVGPVRLLTDGSHPTWSPNGSWIAFARTVAGNTDIWAIALAGGTPVQLTTDPGVDTDPSWNSSGTTIAYTHGDLGCIRFLTNVPDTTIGVQPMTWSGAKSLYR